MRTIDNSCSRIFASLLTIGVLLLPAGPVLADGGATGSEGPVINASAGSVRGVLDGKIASFKGIPYAAAPIGNLRWRPPQAPARWDEVREARDGTPVARGQVDWRAYGDTSAFLLFAGTPQEGTQLLGPRYALNEAVVCRRRAAGDQPWHWNVGIASSPLPPRAEGCQ